MLSKWGCRSWINTTSTLQSLMLISWLWVCYFFLFLTVLTRVWHHSPQPQEEDGPLFQRLAGGPCWRGWKCCSWSCKCHYSVWFHTLLTLTHKFIEHYNEINKKVQPLGTCVHKAAAPTTKKGHWHINDTDSSDDDNCPLVINSADCYLEEWNHYINTNEVAPEDMGIVH